MPRKASKNQNSTPDTQEKVPVVAESNPAPAKPAAPKKVKLNNTTPVMPNTTSVAETSSSTAMATTASSSSGERKRTTFTRESVDREFGELVNMITAEISSLHDQSASASMSAASSSAPASGGAPTAPGKTKGVKFLRTLNKHLKSLRAHTARVLTKKQKTRRNNQNSGFLKPVLYSKDLSEFVGTDPETPQPRSCATKFICDYIKSKQLQNPEDRRIIMVDKDKKLAKLLKYDKTKENTPLTYCSLQYYLKNHFSKVEEDDAENVALSEN